MTPEDKQYKAALNDAKRNYPLNKDEMWPQKLPVFPIPELRKCFEDFAEQAPKGTAFDFYLYLLRQSKTEQQEEKELFERLMYVSIDDINFGRWLSENGWQPYDGNDRWINLADKNKVEPITKLFEQYRFEKV